MIIYTAYLVSGQTISIESDAPVVESEDRQTLNFFRSGELVATVRASQLGGLTNKYTTDPIMDHLRIMEWQNSQSGKLQALGDKLAEGSRTSWAK